MARAKAVKSVTKGARTRQFIKDTVLDFYRCKDIRSVTLNQILQATDLTVGAFYFHFKSKEELLEEIAIDSCRDYHNSIVNHVDWSADFHALARSVIGYCYQSFLNDPGVTKLIYTVIYRSHRAYAEWQKSRQNLQHRIEEEVARAMDSSSVHALDPVFTSYWLLSSLEDFMFSVFMAKGSKPLREIASNEATFVDQQAILWYRSVMGEDPA